MLRAHLKMTKREARSNLALERTIFAYLGGLGVLVVVSLLQLPTLDLALQVSLFAIAIALPLGALSVYTTASKGLRRDIRRRTFALRAGRIAILLVAVAFGSLFFHFSWLFGAAFAGSTAVALYYRAETIYIGLPQDNVDKSVHPPVAPTEGEKATSSGVVKDRE